MEYKQFPIYQTTVFANAVVIQLFNLYFYLNEKYPPCKKDFNRK
nr:hypothetical protein [uncultured Sediminibacterium sp.]